MRLFDDQQLQFVRYWLPVFASGFLAWAAFLILGDTPLIRASGLTLVIIGVTLALRKMGAILAAIGGLTLAFSEAFWSQTGGGDAGPATITIAIAAAITAALIFMIFSKKTYAAIGLGILIFMALFWSQIGTPRSLRLTSLVMAWLLYLLIDMLLLTNPRPDAKPIPPRPHHIPGILLLFIIGVLNDSLLVLLTPAILLSLLLTHSAISNIYWLLLGLATAIGAYGITVDYINVASPILSLDEWRNAARWIDLIHLIINQFTAAGVILSGLGLARLSRWYPPLGTVTMVGYAFYAFFALVYTGRNREVLLLPLFIIQITWMTYAMLTLAHWLSNALPTHRQLARWLVYILYALLPLILLNNII